MEMRAGFRAQMGSFSAPQHWIELIEKPTKKLQEKETVARMRAKQV
jgi:hypothetical protein